MERLGRWRCRRQSMGLLSQNHFLWIFHPRRFPDHLEVYDSDVTQRPLSLRHSADVSAPWHVTTPEKSCGKQSQVLSLVLHSVPFLFTTNQGRIFGANFWHYNLFILAENATVWHVSFYLFYTFFLRCLLCPVAPKCRVGRCELLIVWVLERK